MKKTISLMIAFLLVLSMGFVFALQPPSEEDGGIISNKTCSGVIFQGDDCFDFGDVLKVKEGDSFETIIETVTIKYIGAIDCVDEEECGPQSIANLEIGSICREGEPCLGLIREIELTEGEITKLDDKISLKLEGVEASENVMDTAIINILPSQKTKECPIGCECEGNTITCPLISPTETAEPTETGIITGPTEYETETCPIGCECTEESITCEIEELETDQESLCVMGCYLAEQGVCIIQGTRTSDQYCDFDSKLKDQKAEGSCNNNYECSSNLCIDGECVSAGLWKKFLTWFKNLFA